VMTRPRHGAARSDVDKFGWATACGSRVPGGGGMRASSALVTACAPLGVSTSHGVDASLFLFLLRIGFIPGVAVGTRRPSATSTGNAAVLAVTAGHVGGGVGSAAHDTAFLGHGGGGSLLHASPSRNPAAHAASGAYSRGWVPQRQAQKSGHCALALRRARGGGGGGQEWS